MTSKEKKNYRQTKAFKSLRRFKLQEADNCCALCHCRKIGKFAQSLQIHHVDPEAYGREDEKDFTVVLCSACHEYLELKIKVINNPKNKLNEKLYELLKPFSVLIKDRKNDNEKS